MPNTIHRDASIAQGREQMVCMAKHHPQGFVVWDSVHSKESMDNPGFNEFLHHVTGVILPNAASFKELSEIFKV